MTKRIIAYKTKEMKKILKHSLGIDVSKSNLSLPLGSLTGELSKVFKAHPDISNDVAGFKVLLK
ncbi:hypothetical protein [Muriicola sp.]|uniref:hypothetical protein n=1 Tax=Muriicola sp. TaxID=2020856 RepID=UPI003C71D956